MIKNWENFNNINEELESNKISRILGVYDELISQNKVDDPGIVGWRSHENQRIRFKQLLKYINEGDSILDYGCGVGDLFGFVDGKLDYTGIDINPKMVSAAKGKYPEGNFNTMDSPYDFEKYKYDWFIASGVFSNYMSEKEMISVVKPAFKISKKGLAINFLISKNVSQVHGSPENKNGYLRGYNPKKLLVVFKKEITPNVELITGYAKDDFTLILRK